MEKVESVLNAKNLKIAIVASKFNDFIVENLVQGAVDFLKKHENSLEDLKIFYVPGAYEIPFAAQEVAFTNNYDAIICLGAVIRGSTSHYDFVAGESVSGISKVSLSQRIPISFGILTTETIEQAIERAGTKLGNKGWEAASAAVEMANLKLLLKKFS